MPAYPSLMFLNPMEKTTEVEHFKSKKKNLRTVYPNHILLIISDCICGGERLSGRLFHFRISIFQ